MNNHETLVRTGKFSADSRHETVSRMESETLDVLVIGGGITGAGILLDGVTRGMAIGLVEMQDFAAGTSSRSTKLVHGGLRYLKQFEVALVAEVGRERAIVYENAPHVTTPLWMLLPIVEKGTYGKFLSRLGLYVYDRLARVKHDERRRILTKKQALDKEPLLRQDILKAAGYYVEYRTDDARLTLEIVKEAVERGALAINYTKAERLLYENGKIVGAQLVELISGQRFSVYAKKVINATGPWVDELRLEDGSKTGKTVHLTKGVHIVISQSRFPLHNPVYFDVPDGRMIFAIPRDGKTYVGTTDTDYTGDVKTPRTTAADRDYLIDAVNYMFPSIRLTAADVESFWAGVRPLIQEEGRGPSEISRRDEVFVSPSGLITIAGGKLTGYRKMAEKVVSLVAKELSEETGDNFGHCQTEHIALSGGKFGGSDKMEHHYLSAQIREGLELGLTRASAEKLARRYGTNVSMLWDILRKAQNDARISATAGEKSELDKEVYASLVYGIKHEMVVTPSDFFIRRTGAMFFDVDWVRLWKEPVIAYMAAVNDWTEDVTEGHRKQLDQQLAEATEVVPRE